jgi:Ecdysteroid kinase-like family
MLPVPRSWSDIDAAWMSRALSREVPGTVVHAVRIMDVSDGTNRRARVQLTYQANPGPARVFVKREGGIVQRLALAALDANQAEARLFRSRAPLPIEHPRCLDAATNRHGTVIVLEDVTLRHAVPSVATQPLPVDVVRRGLVGLASLHAAYWGRALPEALGFVGPWRYEGAWRPFSYASLVRARHLLRSQGPKAALAAAFDASTIERGFHRWAQLASSGPQTLLHGDPHVANTYVLDDGSVGFFDWQLVRRGTWAHDVGYFLVSALSSADRRAHERELLAAYLAALGAGGVQPPDPDDAWSLYVATPSYGLASWLHTLAGGIFQPRDDCLAIIGRFAAAARDLGTFGRSGDG